MWPHGQSVFDEDDCGNWADCWLYGTRVGTRVGHTGPVYPSTRVLTSLIEAKDDGGGGDNWITGAISRAKLQSNHHHQQTNIQFFYRPDALPDTQPTVAKH